MPGIEEFYKKHKYAVWFGVFDVALLGVIFVEARQSSATPTDATKHVGRHDGKKRSQQTPTNDYETSVSMGPKNLSQMGPGATTVNTPTSGSGPGDFAPFQGGLFTAYPGDAADFEGLN
jgi:hypothetical protein